MNSQEFAAIQWLLGLGVGELAARLEVNVRTVRRWGQGDSPIPAGVAATMEEWFSAFLDAQEKALDMMHEIYELRGRVGIPIVDTRPGRAFTRVQYLLACMEDLDPEFVHPPSA